MPGAILAVVILMLVPELGVNALEQVSPTGHEPMTFTPTLSTSRANWCMVSPLDRVIETISPWVTVMVGLGTLVLLVLFHAETKPTNAIERLAATTLGTDDRGVNSRTAARSKRAARKKMQNLRLTMRKLLHR